MCKHCKNIFYLFLFWCGLLLQVYAQNKYYIEGKVLSGSGKPLASANVIIKENGIGTSTDEEGFFIFKNLPAKNITLVISFTGYNSLEEKINLPELTTSWEENSPGHIFTFRLKENPVSLEEVVVTGTRTEKKIENSPIKTEVISNSDIKHSAFTRLDQVLLEQPGLAVVDEPWGRGVQMQGLDPNYTLILIDGEPLIGRPGGTLELTRFSVLNLKQIEIVKGPSSSLYGSEALAGVINLITEAPKNPYELNLQSFYKTNNTIDLLGNASLNRDNVTATVFFERLSSDGYNLTPASPSLTAPQFHNYTLSPKIKYRFDDSSILKLNSRIFIQEQKNIQQITSEGNSELLNSRDKLTNWDNTLSFEHGFTSSVKSKIGLYLSRYLTDSKSTFQNNGSLYDHSRFDQYLYKAEIKNDFILNDKNYLVAGGGYFSESIQADRIYNGKKTANSYYLFAQEEWIPNETFDFVIGTRFDHHSEYTSRLSPKISALIKPFSFLKVRASVGGGFKAPTLQQLYLDFTNAQVGYSVFGSSNILESFRQLQQQGQIQRILIDPSGIEKIRAENSIGFNLDFQITPPEGTGWNFLVASINLFRNNVKDLIEASPIAVKTNGQSVFTYFNLNKIYTQGIETGLNIKTSEDLSFSVSYQYLEANDKEVLDQIRNGEISKVGSNGKIRLVQESEYGGLFNRSKNSGTLKIDYQNEDWGLSANLRGVIRGRYGFGDTNGNGILDNKSEYVPGYAIWNFTLSKQLSEFLNIQFGMENIFDKTNSEFIPSLPGRIIYGGFKIEFSKSNN